MSSRQHHQEGDGEGNKEIVRIAHWPDKGSFIDQPGSLTVLRSSIPLCISTESLMMVVLPIRPNQTGNWIYKSSPSRDHLEASHILMLLLLLPLVLYSKSINISNEPKKTEFTRPVSTPFSSLLPLLCLLFPFFVSLTKDEITHVLCNNLQWGHIK